MTRTVSCADHTRDINNPARREIMKEDKSAVVTRRKHSEQGAGHFSREVVFVHLTRWQELVLQSNRVSGFCNYPYELLQQEKQRKYWGNKRSWKTGLSLNPALETATGAGGTDWTLLSVLTVSVEEQWESQPGEQRQWEESPQQKAHRTVAADTTRFTAVHPDFWFTLGTSPNRYPGI